jgi:hypothetical protein
VLSPTALYACALAVSAETARERQQAAHRDVDDAPDAARAVLVKDGADLVGLREVGGVRVERGRVLVAGGRVGGQRGGGDLLEARVDLRVRVVEVVDRDDLEAPRGLQDVHDVRACARGGFAGGSGGDSEGGAPI